MAGVESNNRWHIEDGTDELNALVEGDLNGDRQQGPGFAWRQRLHFIFCRKLPDHTWVEPQKSLFGHPESGCKSLT